MSRSILIPPLIVLLLLLGPATPAEASEWVQGDIYRFRLPDGFEKLDLSTLANGAETEQALAMFDEMFGSFMDTEFHLFVRKRGAQPDAFLGAVAIQLDDRIVEQAAGQLNLDLLETQFRQALDQGGMPIEDGTVRRITVGANLPALEMEVTAHDPQLDGLSTSRMLILIEDASIVVVVFQGLADQAIPDLSTWRAVVSSFRLEGQSSIVRFLLKYGPFVLGGLVLVLLVVLLKRPAGGGIGTGPLARPVATSSPLDMAPGSGGPGLSRPMDGLPVYGAAASEPRQDALPGGVPSHEEAGVGPGPTAQPTNGMRKIPRAKALSPLPGVPDSSEAAPQVPGDLPAEPRALDLAGPAPTPPGPPPLPRLDPPLGASPGSPPPLPPLPKAPPSVPLPPPLPSHQADPGSADRLLQPQPGGEVLPTNVARRDPDTLSRLVPEPGRDDPPEPEPEPEPARQPERAQKTPPVLKIQRNRDTI